MHRSSSMLLAAAAFSFGIALLHLGAVVWGPAAYTYLAAPELGRLEAAGSWTPDLITVPLAGVFAVFGWYALAGAGRARRPPALLPGLLLIGSVYTLRGLVALPQAVLLARDTPGFPPRYLAFSLVSLAGGLVYLAGVASLWRARPAEA